MKPLIIFSLGFFSFSTFACEPNFPYKQNWFGADAAYSIALENKKNLWLFGDTFIGNSRSLSSMLANSIGISTCKGGQWDIKYHWGRKTKSSAKYANKSKTFPQDLYKETKDEKLWPKHGFVHNNNLYIFFDRIITTIPGDPYGFKGIGTTMVIVKNLSDYLAKGTPPHLWKTRYIAFNESENLFPGAAIAKKDGYAYLYSTLDGEGYKHHPMVLIRMPLSKKLEKNIQYFSKSGRWKKGVNWKEAKIIMPDGSNEMSVRYMKEQKKWIAIYSESEFASPHIVYRTADFPEGPWSEEKHLYTVSEADPKHKDFDKNVFCYAAKEHPQFSTKRYLLITYVCNAYDPLYLTKKIDAYVPKVIKVSMPKELR